MNIKRIIYSIVAVAAIAAAMTSCKVRYTFSGASIPMAAKTVSIAYFPNNAPMVAPSLSSTLTDALQDKFMRQTKLELVQEGGDLAFEGEITNYTASPSAISGDQTAQMYRLTITVKVRYTSVLEPQNNYNKSFTAYEDFDANKMLQDVEPELIPQIVEKLVEDIFNQAVANW